MESSSAIADVFLSAASVHGLAASARAVARCSLSLSALDSVAPPTVVRSDIFRHASAPIPLTRRSMRWIRRRTLTEGGGEDDGFFGDGDGDDGPFGGGGDGGRGWNSGDSCPGWDGSGESPLSDPAFDFIYWIVCWIALSNCTHFAFKKMGRLLAPRGPSVC